MRQFPTTFQDTVTRLDHTTDDRGNAALQRLHDRGFVVATGLSPFYAGAIGIMGQQQHIREYCPRDATPSRFATLNSTAKWLTKGGGRAVFLLIEKDDKDSSVVDGQLQGYGWTGYEPCDELPNSPITSAYRLGTSALGRKLAGDFIQTVVSGTHTLYAPEDNIGLETWQSNHAAELYRSVGFEIQEQADQQPELRPTLDPLAIDGVVQDTRLYMNYRRDLFAESVGV